MAAAPGWYPAGEPGRERWWDGVQWTAYERDAVASAVQTATLPQPSAVGWYALPTSGEPRWWDGQDWTVYRVKNGRPGADAFVIEPAPIGWVLGGLMLLGGLLTLLGTLEDPFLLVISVPCLVLGTLVLVGSAKDVARRKLPAPSTAPLADGILRPLPGEVEAEGAGWKPVSSTQVYRWWTGARWATYAMDRGKVRPTHTGPRAYVSAMILFALLAALALGLIGTAVVLGAAGDEEATPMTIVLGVLLLILSGFMAVSVWLRRYALILPKAAPLK
ncbi:DUF2510 domain-containing protein [Microbacterium sp. NPDC057650]|uniref:DUF2510 domain-containing protein n=1 Tax=unclassified Microbacterium TaxID=2609290 RepID=UPI0036706F0F